MTRPQGSQGRTAKILREMRTGAEYRESLRDGRKVWVVGEGLIDDVTVHPATRAMVDEYVAWYDRHSDPAWQHALLAPPGAGDARRARVGLFPCGARPPTCARWAAATPPRSSSRPAT